MITPRKIYQFIEGNLKMLGDAFDLLPTHTKEQVAYRSEICKNDCMQYGYCVNCGCEVPGKLYVNKSCNGGYRFPDLMEKDEWDKFKIKNNIDLKI